MLKKTVLVHALSIAFSAGLASAVFVPTAFAQSQTTGAIAGQATAGSVITVENKTLGISRRVTASADGTFGVSQLPPGNYVLRTTYADGTSEDLAVTVTPGGASSAVFAGPSTGQKVIVTGRASRIDVKSPESSMVLNKEAIDRVPVTRDVTAVAMLAPGATMGDSRIGQTSLRAGNVPSLGGASPAENVYYINGFNVTNSVNGVAFNQVPFDAIGSQQVKTGGYGPEYGRSLGGVLSVTTKRGTNEWKGGVNVIYQPEDLAADEVYGEVGKNGYWNLHNRPGGTDDLKSNLWIGGPVIQDKLFIFGLVQGSKIKQNVYGNSKQTETESDSPTFLVKVDWNINDSNTLEFTGFTDKNKEVQTTWTQGIPYGTVRADRDGTDRYTTGGENMIAKYTTWLTDDLTISAMYGVGKYNRKSDIESARLCPFVQDRRVSGPPIQLGCATSATITVPGANDKRTAYRVDAEWTLGSHGLRFGMDNEEYDVVDGTNYSRGQVMQVRGLNPGSRLSNGYVNNTGVRQEYVSIRHFENGGVFTTKNTAFYVEDNWQVTKNLVANVGVRSESFNNLNATGDSFIDVSNTIAPRLGLVWDVKGDQQTKVFANAGRYYIPVMSNTNVRLAGTELDYTDYYAFTGTFAADRTKEPGLGAQLGSRLLISNGETPDPRTVVDPDIKPMYQDEYILGAEQAMGNRWTVRAKLTHRNLKSVMDDVCNDEGALEWALQAGFDEDEADAIAGTVGHCFLYNPGGDLKANVDLHGDGNLTVVTIPASFLKFPKPKRTYNALELGFERAWDGLWSLQGSYVLGFNKGNTEGYVKSDIGQDDAGISQDWDYPGLAEGSYGYLPNDRRHTLKVFGSYQVMPELRIGANVIVQSGRPRNCLGYYAGNIDSVSIFYGAASFWCGSKLNPRGSFGRTNWMRDVSLQATYEPKWLKGTTFQVDVLNVFNERTVRSVEEGGESAINTPSTSYEQPIGIQPSRKFRFTAQYEF